MKLTGAMGVMIALCVGVVADAAGPAARKDRSGAFDLQCKGVQNRWTGGNPDAWSERLRLDVDGKRWCRGDCLSPAPITEVTTDHFRMVDSRGSAPPHGAEIVISRTDGSITERVRMGPDGEWSKIIEGFCTRERFGGFQPTKF
jgi:hypothetical protein